VLTVDAESNGIVGLVIDSCARDIAVMTRRGFPVSPSILVRGTIKAGFPADTR
jgi:regulator of RNase E activity RraA